MTPRPYLIVDGRDEFEIRDSLAAESEAWCAEVAAALRNEGFPPAAIARALELLRPTIEARNEAAVPQLLTAAGAVPAVRH